MDKQYLNENTFTAMLADVRELLSDKYGIDLSIERSVLENGFNAIANLEVQDVVPFSNLRGQQWQHWFDEVRRVQTESGLDVETITQEATDKQAEQLYLQHNGDWSSLLQARALDNFHSEINCSENDQMSNFGNACLSGYSEKFVCSVAVYPVAEPASCQAEVVANLQRNFYPLLLKYWRVEVQIGEENTPT